MRLGPQGVTIAFITLSFLSLTFASASAKRLTPSLESNVKRIIAALDSEGRWLNRDRIETRLFIRNAGVLCNYLEAEAK
jgi:hypothetical protein